MSAPRASAEALTLAPKAPLPTKASFAKESYKRDLSSVKRFLLMMMIAFITFKSSLVPLLEGL